MDTLANLRDECKRAGVDFKPTHTIKQLKDKLNKKIMSDNLKNGVVTPEQIAQWKKDHKKVFKIEIEVDGKNDVAVGYFKNPSRDHKAVALSMYSQNKILECGEFLRDNCWLGGDDRLKTNEDIADSAAIKVSGIVKFLEGNLGEV